MIDLRLPVGSHWCNHVRVRRLGSSSRTWLRTIVEMKVGIKMKTHLMSNSMANMAAVMTNARRSGTLRVHLKLKVISTDNVLTHSATLGTIDRAHLRGMLLLTAFLHSDFISLRLYPLPPLSVPLPLQYQAQAEQSACVIAGSSCLLSFPQEGILPALFQVELRVELAFCNCYRCASSTCC